MRKIALALFALAASVPVHGAAPARTLPPPVRAALAEFDELCQSSGGMPGKSPDLVKMGDFNADGLRDYAIDVNMYDCQGAASAMGNGQMGAALQLFAGTPKGGATLAYHASTYGIRIEPAKVGQRLWVDVTAIDCGQRNAARLPISQWKYCSRPLDWVAAKRVFVLAPLSQMKPVQ